MAAGRLRAVVCTSSLDLGVDWGDVDLVINVGAPKGASRLLQRIGRANHRMDEPSKGVLVPANRFEVLECRAALDAIAENAQDTPPLRTGALDVLAQHVLGCACGEPFPSDELYAEVTTAAPYAALTRADFDAVVDFVATGGYALKAYERFARIRQGKDGRWRIANPNVAQRYRLNVGTIVEADMLKVRLVRSRASKMIPRGGRLLGQVEEYFVETMVPGDTFVFAGEILQIRGAGRGRGLCLARDRPKIRKCRPTRAANFRSRPISPSACAASSRIRRNGAALPAQVREWLEIQQWRSQMPGRRELLVETFPRANKHYLVCYPFEGRLAHQTLGMLLTRRLERARLRPMGFVANEYALAVWGLGDVGAAHCARRAFARRAVRRGHARRRSRSLARRIGADEAHVPQLRDHRRPDRAPLSRARRNRAARSRSRPTSSTTCCAATSPTTCCCAPRAPTPRPACSTCAGSAKCSRASGAESSIKRSTTSRRSRFR